MKRNLLSLLATGFYLGRAPFMPGTFGTILGLPLAWILFYGGPMFYMVATVILILFAIAVSELYEQQNHSHDPKEVVIDEVVGYLVAFCWLPLTWQSFLAAFLLFRFFDILKPWPIRYLDKNVKGGLGTVVDDLAAGLAANLILQIVFKQTHWLGEQLQGIPWHGN